MLKKFLQTYTSVDTVIFPLRNLHAIPIQEALLAHSMVVIHGPAGSGKTSLLQTQIAFELIQKGCRLCFIDFFDDPIEELRAALFGVKVKDLNTMHMQRSILQIVSDNRPKANFPLVLIFDPLESLFELKGSVVIRNFFETISRILNPLATPNQPMAHVVFVLRSNFLPILTQYAPHFTDANFGKCIELPHLDRSEAQLALNIFILRTGFNLSEKLQSLLVRDYFRNHLGTVDFQILLRRLYEITVSQKQENLGQNSPVKVVIPSNRYQSLGGILEITRSFLDYEIDWIIRFITEADNEKLRRKGLLAQRPLSEKLRQEALYRQGIRLILKNLVTSNQVSAPGSRRGIGIRIIGEASGITHRMVYRLFAVLEKRGLLIKLPTKEIGYVLSQSFFTQQINGWIKTNSKSIIHNKMQDRLRILSSECIAFNRNFPKDELEQITPHANELAFSKDELKWAFRSAVVNKIQPFYWYKRLLNEGLPISDLMEIVFKESTFQEKEIIIQSLFKIGVDSLPWLHRLLEDNYPQVRAFSIGALERLDPTNDWKKQLVHDSYVPAGKFTLGIRSGNFIDESLAHTVNLDNFYISKTTVTFADYRRFLESKEELFDFSPDMEKRPIVNLSWFEAVEYATWAHARLPSEAEWEKAASWQPSQISATFSKRRYPWGDQFNEYYCNMRTSKLNKTSPVGSFSPQGDSAFGCKDMAGNVWEWSNSVYKPYPYNQVDGRENNTTTGSRVIRGGSFESGPSYITCTVRQAFDPYSRRNDLGCRCVLVIPDANEWL